MYLEVSASSLAFSSKARRACSISRFLRSLFVCLLQFFLLRLEFSRQLLRLLQQAFGLHRCFDAVQNDADAGCELLKEGQMRSSECAQRCQLNYGFDPVLKQHGKDDDIPRYRLE